MKRPPITKAEVARKLGVSRTYITLICQGKRKPSQQIVDKLTELKMTVNSGINTCTQEHLTFNQGVAGSRPARPTSSSNPPLPYLLSRFLESRRQGTSPRTIEFYQATLTPFVRSYPLTHTGINLFLSNLDCHNGKHAYYRALRAYCNWLYRQDYIKNNPIDKVDAPKVTKAILPSLNLEEVNYLIEQAEDLRDKAIISLLADSGIRLNELANIKTGDIDWINNTVIIWAKGGKQRKAPFTKRTATMLREVVASGNGTGNIWGLRRRGIQIMLYRLQEKTGLPCNPHTFRRTFASNLHRRGLDVEHIMRLGGWESLDMVLRYTKSVKWEESLRLYQATYLTPAFSIHSEVC